MSTLPVAKAIIGCGYIGMAIAGTVIALHFATVPACLAGGVMWAFFLFNRVTAA